MPRKWRPEQDGKTHRIACAISTPARQGQGGKRYSFQLGWYITATDAVKANGQGFEFQGLRNFSEEDAEEYMKVWLEARATVVAVREEVEAQARGERPSLKASLGSMGKANER